MAICKHCTHPVLSDGMVCDACWKVVAHVPVNVPLAAEKIGIPAERWGGNCHSVSVAFVARFGNSGLELPGARVRRGWRAGYGGQHSWIELDRGIVVDPTWTALQGERVRVLVTDGAAYDPCGWRSVHGEHTVGDPPSLWEEERAPVHWGEFGSAGYVAGLVGAEPDDYGDDWIVLGVRQIAWLAHLPVLPKEGQRNLSSFFAAEVYEAIAGCGLKALIPIDAWHYVMDIAYPDEPDRPSGARR